MVRRLIRSRIVTAQIDESLYNKMQQVRSKTFKKTRASITNIQASRILALNIGRIRLNAKPKRRRY